MILIGIAIGVLAALLKQFLTFLDEIKWSQARKMALVGEPHYSHLTHFLCDTKRIVFDIFDNICINNKNTEKNVVQSFSEYANNNG